MPDNNGAESSSAGAAGSSASASASKSVRAPRRHSAGRRSSVASASMLSPALGSAALAGASGGGGNANSTSVVAETDEDAIDEIKRYESFSTVDWLVDGSRERARLARARARRLAALLGSDSAAAAAIAESTSAAAQLRRKGRRRAGDEDEEDEGQEQALGSADLGVRPGGNGEAGPSSSSARVPSGSELRARLAIADQLTSSWGFSQQHMIVAAHDRPPRWYPMHNFWARKAWWSYRFVAATLTAAAESGVVVLVGILIGLNMAVISIATEWASDLKQGYCKAGWWLNAKFCCWEMMDAVGPPGSGGSPTTASLPRPSASAAAAVASMVANATSSAALRLAGRGIDTALWAHSYYLMPRADVGGGAAEAGDRSETCTDWVPWSTWTLPAWFIYMSTAVSLS